MLAVPCVDGWCPRILTITDDSTLLALCRQLRKEEGDHVSIHVSVDDDLTEMRRATTSPSTSPSTMIRPRSRPFSPTG